MSDLSIYIPAFNAEKTIEKCVESILSQSIQPKEILVINDASTDNTLNILKKYKVIKIISNKINLGVSESMNIATNFLKSRYVAKIDADVELSSNWVEALMKKLIEKDITLIGGKMYEKYTSNPYNLWRSIRLKQNWGEKDIKNPKFIFGCNNILDTKKIPNIKKYRTDLEYFKTNGEDIEFSNFLIKNNHKLYYCSKAICYHLQNDTGFSLASRYWRYIYYGDGMKKKNLFKTIKNILRQFKKTFKWTLLDIFKVNFKLIPVNIIIFFYFTILELKFYKKNKIK